MKKSARLLFVFILLLSAVMAVRLVHEPDLWWQVRTGEWILEHQSIPKTDAFSYTYPDAEWLNVKWGYEVLQALITRFWGAEFLPLLQIAGNLALVWLILANIRLFGNKNKIPPAIATLAVLFFLLGYAYRMNARPEVVTYVLTAAYLYILHRHHQGNRNILLWLIPLQMIWVNMHEAYGTGMVMMAVYFVIISTHYLALKYKTAAQKSDFIFAVAVIAGAVVVNAVHPWGLRMITHPYEIFTQLGRNTFTAEILGASSASYWKLPAFLNLLFALAALSAIRSAGKGKNGTFSLKQVTESIPLFHVVLLAAFFYLSLKSYRNIPFFLVTATPLMAMTLGKMTQKIKEKTQIISVFSASLAFYLLIVTNVFYQKLLPAEVYGLGVNPAKTPVGAANFIARNKLQEPSYSDYLSSSYLLWHLKPDYKTFLDLRDLDVFEEGFIQTAINTYVQPDMKTRNGYNLWDFLDSRMNFHYVALLNNPQFINLHKYLHQRAGYDPVYADELMTIYLKPDKGNQAVIEQYGYSAGHNIFHETPQLQRSKAADIISKIFWPFYSPVDYTQQSKGMQNSVYQFLGLTTPTP